MYLAEYVNRSKGRISAVSRKYPDGVAPFAIMSMLHIFLLSRRQSPCLTERFFIAANNSCGTHSGSQKSVNTAVYSVCGLWPIPLSFSWKQSSSFEVESYLFWINVRFWLTHFDLRHGHAAIRVLRFEDGEVCYARQIVFCRSVFCRLY